MLIILLAAVLGLFSFAPSPMAGGNPSPFMSWTHVMSDRVAGVDWSPRGDPIAALLPATDAAVSTPADVLLRRLLAGP